MTLGELAEQQGDLDKAVSLYREVVGRTRHANNLHYLSFDLLSLARVRLAQGDSEAALRYYTELRPSPGRGGEKARAELEKALRQPPGRILLELGRRAEAKESTRRPANASPKLSARPHRLASHRRPGEIHYEEGDLEKPKASSPACQKKRELTWRTRPPAPKPKSASPLPGHPGRQDRSRHPARKSHPAAPRQSRYRAADLRRAEAALRSVYQAGGPTARG